MNHFDFELDQFQPLPKHALYVYGSAVIEYEWCPGDPDTGCSAGPDLVRVVSLYIDADDGDDVLEVKEGGLLFDLIANALLASEHVQDAARAHYEESRQWRLI